MTKSILIASYLEPDYVEQIRRVDGGIEVMYRSGVVSWHARPS